MEELILMLVSGFAGGFVVWIVLRSELGELRKRLQECKSNGGLEYEGFHYYARNGYYTKKGR